ncbi:DUF1450 domain-containing protein [Effusibacillus consociatus]|uniref:DUF1450 domain-containing protein n=1 Tax=Effusibacillus consociatus TaxID=1117041 RepID=A0ABV9Q373_9BACL
MQNIIKFCTSNYLNGSDDIKAKALKNPNLQVIEQDCLGNCGQCYLEAFAVVDGKAVTVSTYEELLSKLDLTLMK